MPKVRPQTIEQPVVPKIYNQDLGGVKVTIQLYSPKPDVEMIISIPYPCSWRGKLFPKSQLVVTDQDGKVVIYLPPSGELSPVNASIAARKGPTLYKLECPQLDKVVFEVPNRREWRLGA